MTEFSKHAYLGDGPAAMRIGEIDWRSTSLGDPDGWSESLKCGLATMMRSNQSMLLMVGPELLQFYNDAYIAHGGGQHPAQMGQSAASFWPERYPLIADLIADVLANASSVERMDRPLAMIREGREVETYWSYRLDPFVDGAGVVRGVLLVSVETTRRVLTLRRQGLLDAVSAALSECGDPSGLAPAAARVLAEYPEDVASVRFASADSPSPLWAALRDGHPTRAGGEYVVPLAQKGAPEVIRYVALGINPRLSFDEAYEQHLAQVVQRIGQSADRLEAATARSTGESERNELLRQAPIATALLLGPRLVFSLVNERYCEMVGRRDLVGKTYEEAFPELVGTDLPPLLHELYATGRNYTSPETLVVLDRSRTGVLEDCHFRFTIQPVKTIDGDVYGLVAVANDVTEEVRARVAAEALHLERQSQLTLRSEQLEQVIRERTRALEDALQFNRSVTDAIPESIAYCDADLVCRLANDRFCSWVGKDRSEVVGQHVSALFSAEALRQVGAHLEGVLRGVPQTFERHYVRDDGTRMHYQINYVPEQRTDATQRTGLYFMAIDITALKEAERDLVALNVDLERSRREAQEANRAKSAFLANMSHEIRTPLNAILGMTHLLAREISIPEHRRRLGKVDAAAKHLLGIISDVLDLSKIEAGKLELEESTFDIAALVDSTLEMVRGPAQLKGLALVDDTARLFGAYTGDSLRLSQILLNLLSNAVKFTVHGTVTLHGELVASVDKRHRLRFEVEDTGVGIDPARQASLFAAFEQADSSINRQYGGTGLGLALSRQLARAMGGDAGLDSQVGVGSRFWFTVWLGGGDTRADASSPLPESMANDLQLADLEHRLRTLHRARRVLLAEDNPVSMEVATALLEDVGLVVDTARDGQEALDLIERKSFDVVLMDMQMPRVDGLEATREIRARQLRVPIIAMTANAFVEDRHACLAAGMDDHLTKPVDPAVLYSRLLRWLPTGAKQATGGH